MCTCRYCFKEFIPRPQVKNAKACTNKSCQKKRQSENEFDWRKDNKQHYPPTYYADKKIQRHRWLLAKAAATVEALMTGMRFLGKAVIENEFRAALNLFFIKLGIRQTNKLWPS